MIHKIKTIAITVLAATVLLTNCKKDDTGGTGVLELEFENSANGNLLKFNTNYTNNKGETMQFTSFKYYVSNIKLTDSKGGVFTIPKNESYFLIDESKPVSKIVRLQNIPAGDYKNVSFTIGVDSAKSVAPLAERTGVLDPTGNNADMYWEWNSGYIFVKAEGTCAQIVADSNNPNKQFFYHIGLFGGYNAPTLNNLVNVSLSQAGGEIATVTKTKTPQMHIKADVMEMFKTPNTISIVDNPFTMVSGNSALVSANYKDMFKLDHIH